MTSLHVLKGERNSESGAVEIGSPVRGYRHLGQGFEQIALHIHMFIMSKAFLKSRQFTSA
jgi:hypothetical protein